MRKLALLLCLFCMFSCIDDVNKSESLNTKVEYQGEEVHVCTEMSLPDELQGPKTRLGVFMSKKWSAGEQLTVKFLNGDSYLQEKVKQYANEWSTYANVRFIWVSTSSSAQIRVAFNWNGDIGSWSYVGKDALSVSQSEPTVNFGWLNSGTEEREFSRVITHEFGHVLGLIHEHQHPKNSIQWNKEYIYSYYSSTQNWSRSQVDLNYFNKYSTAQLNDFENYDMLSIMHYAIPLAFTLNGFSTSSNYVLSQYDKRNIAIAYPYPPDNAESSTIWEGELTQFSYLQSKNGKYRLYFQPDGNLKLYKVISGVVQSQIWSTNIGNKPYAQYAVFKDGNLKIVDDLYNSTVYWNTNVSYSTGLGSMIIAQLLLQDDGDLVILEGLSSSGIGGFPGGNPMPQKVRWRSNTAGR